MSKRVAKIEVVTDLTSSARCDEGFLRLKRLRLRNRFSDGGVSREYSCDVLSRKSVDAVAVALYHRENGRVFVHLRVATRPPIWLRRDKRDELVVQDARDYDTIEELVAGVIEPGDAGERGLAKRAAAEAKEEAGFVVALDDVRPLGDGFFPSPGVTDEKVYLVAVEVEPASAGAAHGDGSVMEEGSSVVVRELGDAIARCRSGEIPDAKTEIGLLRLADHLVYVPELAMFAADLPADLRARWKPLGVSSREDRR